jgi:hypothetical protein
METLKRQSTGDNNTTHLLKHIVQFFVRATRFWFSIYEVSTNANQRTNIQMDWLASPLAD